MRTEYTGCVVVIVEREHWKTHKSKEFEANREYNPIIKVKHEWTCAGKS